MKQNSALLRSMFSRSITITTALLLVAASVSPLLFSNRANAAQISNRTVEISTSEGDATGVQYDFEFDFASTDVEGIIFEFCTSPLGTCTFPTGMDVSYGNVTLDGSTGFPNGTAFAEVTANTGDCNNVTTNDNTVEKYCISRTEPIAAAGTDATVDLGGITNPTLSGDFTNVFVRINLYDNAGFVSTGGAGSELVHDGVVAASITEQLTVTGRVQERLEFCVASVGDGGATDTTLPTECSNAPDTTQVDIGIIDNTGIRTSPVNNTLADGGNDEYGMAMVNTNAAGGVVVSYYPEAGSGTNELRDFRVDGATCNVSGTSIVDQCFVSAATTGTTFVAGTENFGMQIACVDTSQGTTANLGTSGSNVDVVSNLGFVNTNYSNTDNNIANDPDCENDDAGVKFAWDDTGTPVAIISSDTVVDDEIIKLRFGATASATTPTGTYTVTTTYIATATY